MYKYFRAGNFASLPSRLLLLAFITIILAYLPGLQGSFIHDDFVNIVNNQALHITTLTFSSLKQSFVDIRSGNFQLFSRPVANLSFAINYYLDGLEPYNYKAVNLVIHLIIGWLIYLITQKLIIVSRLARNLLSNNSEHQIDYSWIALIAAALWLFHPLNVSTVLYTVQRMAQLSTLFTLLGFGAYLKSRQIQFQHTDATGSKEILIGLLIYWPLGILSKENAIILPALCLVSEITLFRFRAITIYLLWLHRFFALFIVSGIVYLLYSPAFIQDTYIIREYTLDQRLMTEARVLWKYIYTLLLPDISQMGLYLDDFPLSTGLRHPSNTLLSILGILLSLASALFMRNRLPFWSFSVLWFLTAHIIESSIIGLEIAYEHRNYLPSIGIMIGISYGITIIYQKHSKLRRTLKFSVICYLILIASLTVMRSIQWADETNRVLSEVQHHPRSFRANSELTRILISNKRFDEAEHFAQQAKNSERPYANIYITLLSLEHIRKGQITERFYDEIRHAFSTQVVYISIIDQFTAYIVDAEMNDWETPEILITLTQSLMENPFLSTSYPQSNLYLIMAKLYNDIGRTDLMGNYAEKAYFLAPENVSIAKLFAHVNITNGHIEKARTIIEHALTNTVLPNERFQLNMLLNDIR